MAERRFVLLDRDGTIIKERHYLSNPEDVELLDGATDGLRQMMNMGLGLVVVTNQSGVGRGFFDRIRLKEIHQRMCQLLAKDGVNIEGIYFCPHIPEDNCRCRKPCIGMVERAAQELEFYPGNSFVIGDKPCDIQLGQQVKAKTFLVRTGYGVQVAEQNAVNPDYIVDDLFEAAQVMPNLLGNN